MVKKLLTLVFAAVIGLSFVSTAAFASSAKGQKIFIKFLKKPCGISAAEMAGKHTQEKWRAIYEAGKLNDKILEICPEAKPLRDRHVSSVFDFFHNYASDSGNVPAC